KRITRFSRSLRARTLVSISSSDFLLMVLSEVVAQTTKLRPRYKQAPGGSISIRPGLCSPRYLLRFGRHQMRRLVVAHGRELQSIPAGLSPTRPRQASRMPQDDPDDRRRVHSRYS